MFIDPAVYVFMVAAIILLSIILVSVVISYLATYKRLSSFEEDKDSLFKETRYEQQKAISAAQKKADEIISEASRLKGNTDDILNEATSRIAQDFIKQYQEKAQELNDNSINNYSNISKEISKYMQNYLDDLKRTLSQETMGSQKMVESKFREQYDKLDKELAEYKKMRLDKINRNIYEILFDISKIAFAKGITLEKQEELVTEAFEQIKKESR